MPPAWTDNKTGEGRGREGGWTETVQVKVIHRCLSIYDIMIHINIVSDVLCSCNVTGINQGKKFYCQ